MADRGGHVHEQGGDRDAAAHRGAHRRGGGARGDDRHLPRHLRAHPAARWRGHRSDPELHDLRPGRPGRARQERAQAPRPRREALQPGRDAGLDRAAQGRAGRCRDRHAAGGELLRRDGRPRVRRVPAPAGRGRRRGLRRPAHAGRDPLRGASEGARALPGPLAADPRRRVPGHQPRPVPHLPPAGGEAQEPVGRRRRRPEHLLLARRRPTQHPRLRDRLPRREGRQARAELPLDPDDPRRGPRRRLPQRRAQGQEALDRSRRRAPRSPCSTPTTSTRRPSSSRARSRSSSAARAAAA